MAANWKIVVENYNECLHCPTIHPELVQVVPLYRFGEVWDEETRDDGNLMIEGATSFTRDGRIHPPEVPGPAADDYHMYYGVFQFPNLMVNLHPDCGDVVHRLSARPGPHDRGLGVPLPARDDRPARLRARPVVELWDLISRQDWVVCERAQTGVCSRSYKTGVYPRKDRLLFDFNEQYRREMGRPPLG